jgi:uncharacterized protein
MITTLVRPSAFLAMAAVALVLASCAGSQPARFYTLTALEFSQTVGQEAQVKPGTVVAVGPVGIPDYLDRPQITVRTGDNELAFSEFDRWAGPLGEEIHRAMIENLSVLLRPRGIHVISWKTAVPGRMMVGLSVTRFEATSGGTVNFRALWGLTRDGEKTAQLVRESVASKPLPRSGYGTIAATMSTVLADFSREVAAAIEETSKADQALTR